MRHFKRHMKAISPVLAVLMMIAVAIAGSLITYAWVTGYIGFTTEKAGNAIMIQSIAYDNDTTTLYIYVQNDAVGTQRTGACSSFPDISNFPLTYHLCGDRDCLMITHSYIGTEYNMLWGGKVRPAHPDMDCTYHMVTYGNYLGNRFMLRDCDGNWNQAYTLQNDGTGTDPSSPSQIDAYMTYPIWPYWVRDNPAGGGRDMVGQLKYFYSAQHDGRAADGDFFPIQDSNYRLFSATGLEWAMRIA